MVPEAKLEGGMPQTQGWFVVNSQETRWLYNEMGWYGAFEGKGEAAFEELGINLNLLHPGMPMAMYHEEPGQEAFLVLRGECLLARDERQRLDDRPAVELEDSLRDLTQLTGAPRVGSARHEGLARVPALAQERIE